MKTIKLTQGKKAIVDDDVYEWAKNYRWIAHQDKRIFYAKRGEWIPDRRKQLDVFMQHCIIGRPINTKRFVIDHIDGNGLNNQRSNLRIVSKRINHLNRHEHREGRLAGVSRNRKFWAARIKINGKTISLGNFQTPIEAHQRYMKAVMELEESYAR